MCIWYVCVYKSFHVCAIYGDIYFCRYIYIYVCVCLCVYMLCMCAFMYVCMFLCINLYIYICFLVFMCICDPSDQNQSYGAFFTFLVLYIPRKGNVSSLK